MHNEDPDWSKKLYVVPVNKLFGWNFSVQISTLSFMDMLLFRTWLQWAYSYSSQMSWELLSTKVKDFHENPAYSSYSVRLLNAKSQSQLSSGFIIPPSSTCAENQPDESSRRSAEKCSAAKLKLLSNAPNSIFESR